LLGDLTRPIPTERRLVQHPAVRWVVGAAALAVVVLPVETWRQQDAAIAAKQGQLEVLGQVNAKMAAEVGHLQTVDGARQAARDEMGLIGPGEQRRTIVSNDLASLALPSGFPYDAISQAIATRSVTGQP
jgi:cell division protein FtsB